MDVREGLGELPQPQHVPVPCHVGWQGPPRVAWSDPGYCCLYERVCHIQGSQSDSFNTRTLSSQFRRLGSKVKGWTPDGGLLPASSICAVCVLNFAYKNAWSTRVTSFYLNNVFKDPSSEWSPTRIRASTLIWGTQFSPQHSSWFRHGDETQIC
jgi:hypothetical protein